MIGKLRGKIDAIGEGHAIVDVNGVGYEVQLSARTLRNLKLGEEVSLKLFHEKGQSFGIPLKPDGTFQIGWMPVGKYSVTLIRDKHEGGKKEAPNMYNVPGGLTIQDGQTDYSVDLGKSWKL